MEKFQLSAYQTLLSNRHLVTQQIKIFLKFIQKPPFLFNTLVQAYFALLVIPVKVNICKYVFSLKA